jgi:hypothetical protein
VPLFSLNVSEHNGLIKGGAHESSNHTPHRRKRLFFSFLFFFLSIERKTVTLTDGPEPETDNVSIKFTSK